MVEQIKLILTDDGANNTFERRKRGGGSKEVVRLKRYDVLLDGVKIGEVGQRRETFERKTPGRTYVNVRWQNVRWYHALGPNPAMSTGYSERSFGQYETRKRAIEAMLSVRQVRLKDRVAMVDTARESVDV